VAVRPSPSRTTSANPESVILMPDFPKKVSHIGLHLPERESEFVVMLVRDRRVRREPDVIVGFKSNDVGEEVASGHDDDLDDEVERIIQCAGWVCSRPYQQM